MIQGRWLANVQRNSVFPRGDLDRVMRYLVQSLSQDSPGASTLSLGRMVAYNFNRATYALGLDTKDVYMHKHFRWLLPVLLFSCPFCTHANETASFRQRCWSWMTSCCQDEELRTDCRSCVREFFADAKQPEYGLQISDSLVDESRAVLFVHGWNSRPEDLASLANDARRLGLKSAHFRYPNDQAIGESSELFANALKQLGHVCPDTMISVVTHSMGALVARDAIENPWYRIDNVDRLVMLVPPNHGSHLAKYACSLDIYEYAASKHRRAESGFIVGSILDGLSEATRDMYPTSDFLRQLNSRPRNPDVRYAIVLGTDGIIAPEDMRLAKTGLDRAARRCSWMKKLSNHVDAKAIKYDEVIDGKGDGLVAIESGKLAGVNDVIVGNFSHVDILSGKPNTAVKRVREQVLARLR